MRPNPLNQLIELGTSVWYDNISRDILKNGEMKRLITECGVRGVTSNPTIFDSAIRGSALYDAQIKSLLPKKLSSDLVFEELALEDIAEAADLFRTVYDRSDGVDGFISIEVSPLLAADTEATVAEAKKLFALLDRPNIMVKVPGTAEGLPAIRALLEAGINVNITLLFSVENYVEVAKTYCEALLTRVGNGLPVDRVRSVASFFVSRVDSIVDKKLDEIGTDQAKSLRGLLGVANSRLAYQQFLSIFHGPLFAPLKQKGAKVQRPLWASTGTKNPAYRDTLYVEELIGPDIVNTMPPATLIAFGEHGVVRSTIEKDVPAAKQLLQKLGEVGVDVPGLLHQLQVEGVQKFIESFQSLNEAIAKKYV